MQQRRAFDNLHGPAVDGELDELARRLDGHVVHDSTPSLTSADSMAMGAV